MGIIVTIWPNVTALTTALTAFADAAGEPADDAAILTLLWPTTA